MNSNILYVIAICSGMLFGISLEKGRVFEPLIIRQQMLWSNYLMLKMFLSASAASLLSMTILSKLYPKKFNSVRKSNGLPSVLQVIVGCSILGSGMTICGACPGTILAQMGSGVSSSFITFCGGIIAAVVFSSFRDIIISPLNNNLGLPSGYIDQLINKQYFIISLPLSFIFFSTVILLECIIPWYTEYNVDQNDVFPSIHAVAWPPYFSGLVIGFTQIPIILVLGKTLGASTSFERLGAFISKKLGMSSPYLNKVSSFSYDNIWQIFFLIGALAAAFLSSIISGSFHTAESLNAIPSFIGGFMIIFGARIAGGCTSGHGISGFAKLSVASLFSIPCMFLCGTITALCFI